jgi:hypothetical protein
MNARELGTAMPEGAAAHEDTGQTLKENR